MVKRIKKRIVKKQDDAASAGEGAAPGADDAAAADGPVDDVNAFRAELDSLGEDEFTRTVAGGVGWVVENRGLIVAGVALAAVVVVAIIVMQGQKTSGVEEAATAFNDAAQSYVEAVRPPAPGSDTPALTPEERKARIEKAAQSFQRSAQAYGNEPIAGLIHLGEAGSRLALGDAEAAIGLYEKALSDQKMPAFARAIALQGKAAALETKGDQSAALAAWKEVEGVDKSAFGLMAGMQMGRLLEASGKAGEAKAIYERLKTDHVAELEQLANRALKADLDRRIAQLGEST